MELHIKNMVCPRCIMAVDDILKQLDLQPLLVELGRVVIDRAITETEKTELQKRLKAVGFELIDDKRVQLSELIKSKIIELVHYQNSSLKVNLSAYLSETCRYDYSYLSKLFSEVNGITIEKYVIAQKIERVKELLGYGELSLNEIAEQMNYSSTAYLSHQFKLVTGLTPSQFKQQTAQKRKPLDKIL